MAYPYLFCGMTIGQANQVWALEPLPATLQNKEKTPDETYAVMLPTVEQAA